MQKQKLNAKTNNNKHVKYKAIKKYTTCKQCYKCTTCKTMKNEKCVKGKIKKTCFFVCKQM